MGRLDDLDLSVKMERADYDAAMQDLRKELAKAAVRVRRKKRIAVFVFEGADAAGKGGAIRRLAQAMDPELYVVLPFAAPTPEERARHYLWRFWRTLPDPGTISIFDRSWYGRVLVERVEGFAAPDVWARAYDEINHMEASWVNAGMVVGKFWLQIDQDEQLRRFKGREESPLKNWKLTSEDWRNREKWPVYKEAIEDMLDRTSTNHAPWTLIEANDKLHARAKVMRTALDILQSI
ncbi:MAG: hypothetical protein HY042_11335 [Spirochaetia bacterium]|nr:hypothetical protein [Spirochaetia bacterium]